MVFLASLALWLHGVGVLAGIAAVAFSVLASLLDLVLPLPAGDPTSYHLAVSFVNAVDVKEWAYCNGIAVAVLPSDLVVVLDTRYQRLYLVRWSSLQLYPLPAYGRAKLRVEPLAKPWVVRLGCLQGREAEVVRGYLEAPSVRRAGEVVATHGTFVRMKLRLADSANPRRLVGLSSCGEELADLIGG